MIPAPGQRARCQRCAHRLITTDTQALVRIVTLALTIVILMAGALFFPFLEINVSGLHSEASVFQTALAFADGSVLSSGLTLTVMALIVLIPILRATLVLYTLSPLILSRPAWPRAARAFRLSEALRPWSMAEVFIMGVGVALVKISDLAHVQFGPAFFMFAGLALVMLLKDNFTCRWTLWNLLEKPASR